MALDFHYAEQMIYWTDVTTQGSMIRRMRMNGSNMEVSEEIKHPLICMIYGLANTLTILFTIFFIKVVCVSVWEWYHCLML